MLNTYIHTFTAGKFKEKASIFVEEAVSILQYVKGIKNHQPAEKTDGQLIRSDTEKIYDRLFI